MRVVKVKTTAWEEEDFFLLTTLDNQQITEVVNPLVMAERDGYEGYDNDIILKSLRKRFPHDTIELVTEIEELIY